MDEITDALVDARHPREICADIIAAYDDGRYDDAAELSQRLVCRLRSRCRRGNSKIERTDSCA